MANTETSLKHMERQGLSLSHLFYQGGKRGNGKAQTSLTAPQKLTHRSGRSSALPYPEREQKQGYSAQNWGYASDFKENSSFINGRLGGIVAC